MKKYGPIAGMLLALVLQNMGVVPSASQYLKNAPAETSAVERQQLQDIKDATVTHTEQTKQTHEKLDRLITATDRVQQTNALWFRMQCFKLAKTDGEKMECAKLQ